MKDSYRQEEYGTGRRLNEIYGMNGNGIWDGLAFRELYGVPYGVVQAETWFLREIASCI